jgi:hypothetical protein
MEWSNVLAPYSYTLFVTASDSADLPEGVCRGLIVSADCLLNIDLPDGTTRSNAQFFKGYNPRMVRRVRTGAGAASVTIEAGY